MINIELNEKKIWRNKEWRKTLKIDDLRESFSSDECSIFFFCVLSSFLCVKSPFFRPNCVLFIEHKVWPNFGGNSEPKTVGKRRCNAWRALADRSADNPRSIGADAVSDSLGSRSIGVPAVWHRIVGPIDRLVWRDRSASSLPFRFSSLKLLPIDRLICRDRSAMALSMWSRFPLLQNVPFCVLFHLAVSVLVLKLPVHSQNSLNNIKLRNLTTIQAWICDI